MPTQIQGATERKPSQQTEQKRKELKVTIRDDKEREETKRKDTRRLVAAIKESEPQEATKQIIAARRLPSGDFLLSTLTEKARIELERNNSWLRAIAKTAEARKTVFPVFIHGVRVRGVNTADQKRAIKELCEENSLLHPHLEITRVAWPQQIIKEKKSYSSLILETASPETANRIISQGLIHEGEIKTCVRYLAEGRVTRCFNCQKYGHIARRCKNPTACAECAGNHTADRCTIGPEAKRKCPTCKENHRAGSPHCTVERKEREKAETIRNLASPQYQCLSSPSTLPTQRIAQTPLPTQETNRNQTQLETSSGISVATQRKGRPLLLTQAAKSPSQMSLTFVGLGKRKERDFTPPVPPPARTDRNQSQSSAALRKTFETLYSLSDGDGEEDADQE